jgi:hypothetical protein
MYEILSSLFVKKKSCLVLEECGSEGVQIAEYRFFPN